MSDLVKLIVNQHVDLNTVYLLLALPFIATLIAAFRQVVGVKSFGIYAPLVLTFAFWATDLKYGLTIFAVIFVTGTAVRYILKKMRLLYMPRMAIVLTVISIAILALLAIGGHYRRFGLSSTSILPILIMITLIEKFISAQVEKGLRTATFLSVETLLISVVGYYILIWDVFYDFVLAHPFYIVVLLVINLLLGKWSGLRLSEYLRFRKVIKNVEND
ncbi:MAG: 7TM domain-containing protein [Candidatus Pacebacteria bacterium]|nr:7TM domain-containing protein [Candidatus Paceibacterota bacterium]